MSLVFEFKPPSSGRSAPDNEWEGMEYRLMVEGVRQTLENIDKIEPGYQGQGYEIAGKVASVDTRDFWRDVEEAPQPQDFHYNRSAETFLLTGEAMGRAMVNLLGGKAATIPKTDREERMAEIREGIVRWRREGHRPRGSQIWADFRDEFKGGKVTISVAAFPMNNRPEAGFIPDRDPLSVWIEEMKIPPLVEPLE